MSNQNLTINAIKMLGVDAVAKANSGHPGMVLGAAPIVYTLTTKFLNATPRNSKWFNRDRFILSAGHASMLLYSYLHFAGYKISMEDIKNFRQVNSKTPGHPEFGLSDGVDCTSGPLGQGLAHGVGMAIAEKHLAARYNRQGYEIVDHYTYVLCGDGDMQEGLSQEAISLAGNLGLNKLIVIYDSNDVTLDGPLHLSNTENTEKRFRAANWMVEKVDGSSVLELELAIKKAQLSNFPTLILAKTIIGEGSLNEGTYKVHGASLQEDDIKQLREKLNWHYPPFEIPNEVYEHYHKTFYKRGNDAYKEWNKLFKEYENEYPTLHKELNDMIKQKYPKIPYLEFEVGHKEATRVTSNKLINQIADYIPTFIGGASDVARSVNTNISKCDDFSDENPSGRNINFGIREFAMSCAQSGMILHGGVRPFIGSFLVFSDYFKASIRTAALMELPSINIFTHDSIAVGEDGPTHQPVEQLATLRMIPHVTTIRPANALETSFAWRYALENKKGPVNLILTRQAVKVDSLTTYDEFIKGAYVAKYEKTRRFITIIASGSEVNLIFELGKLLEEHDIDHRLVSMPSTNLYNKLKYREKLQLMGNPYHRIYAIEMGSPDTMYRYAKYVIGLESFGASGKGEEVVKHFGFEAKQIFEKHFSRK